MYKTFHAQTFGYMHVHEYRTMAMYSYVRTSYVYHFLLSVHLRRSNQLFQLVPLASYACMNNQPLVRPHRMALTISYMHGFYNLQSRKVVVSHDPKKKQHACVCSGLCDHYTELFTRVIGLNI